MIENESRQTRSFGGLWFVYLFKERMQSMRIKARFGQQANRHQICLKLLVPAVS